MNLALQLTSAFLNEKDFKHRVDEEDNLITTGIGGLDNKGSMKFHIIFDDDGGSVGIRVFEYCAFPKEKTTKMYQVCSKMNEAFRWVKFYVDEEENTITLADDAVIQLDSCGEEVFELLLRMSSIGDDAYPEFMRAIWS